ncbi:unnamed protein product [Allacma fusca]|uniref:Uncharacterized protein n=1 Tax=Allacma fusca TaxID=39272 RepID=A0A8J2JYD2_9HEXA|nr:unnamed protein product [Allacma fusca]
MFQGGFSQLESSKDMTAMLEVPLNPTTPKRKDSFKDPKPFDLFVKPRCLCGLREIIQLGEFNLNIVLLLRRSFTVLNMKWEGPGNAGGLESGIPLRPGERAGFGLDIPGRPGGLGSGIPGAPGRSGQAGEIGGIGGQGLGIPEGLGGRVEPGDGLNFEGVVGKISQGDNEFMLYKSTRNDRSSICSTQVPVITYIQIQSTTINKYILKDLMESRNYNNSGFLSALIQLPYFFPVPVFGISVVIRHISPKEQICFASVMLVPGRFHPPQVQQGHARYARRSENPETLGEFQGPQTEEAPGEIGGEIGAAAGLEGNDCEVICTTGPSVTPGPPVTPVTPGTPGIPGPPGLIGVVGVGIKTSGGGGVYD